MNNARITIDRVKGGFIVSYDVAGGFNTEIVSSRRKLTSALKEFLDSLEEAELLRPFNDTTLREETAEEPIEEVVGTVTVQPLQL